MMRKDENFGDVPDMFGKSLEGQKRFFSKKFWDALGCVLASSLVSKKRFKIQKNIFFQKNKVCLNHHKITWE